MAGGIGEVAGNVKEAASSFGAIVEEAARVREIGEATRESIADLASRAESISYLRRRQGRFAQAAGWLRWIDERSPPPQRALRALCASP
jgi:hypothetical protein